MAGNVGAGEGEAVFGIAAVGLEVNLAAGKNGGGLALIALGLAVAVIALFAVGDADGGEACVFLAVFVCALGVGVDLATDVAGGLVALPAQVGGSHGLGAAVFALAQGLGAGAAGLRLA